MGVCVGVSLNAPSGTGGMHGLLISIRNQATGRTSCFPSLFTCTYAIVGGSFAMHHHSSLYKQGLTHTRCVPWRCSVNIRATVCLDRIIFLGLAYLLCASV